MKLAPFLAQYLYINKRLDLPGIGSFLLNPDAIIEPEGGKYGKPLVVEGITFESNTSIKDANDLIFFISSQTGKMKALAAADLESYIQLAQQFLNIGNPFTFEGIGSLVKVKSGEYAFVPGEIMPDKIKEYSAREVSATSSMEESFAQPANTGYGNLGKIKLKKPVAGLLIVAGITLAVWGGYTVYKKTTAKTNSSSIKEKKEKITVPVTDTTHYVKKDSVIAPVQNTTSGSYKFILEMANSKRAFERFGKLRSYQWDIRMETKDSIQYKLFVLIPALVSDTARIVDSLTFLNGRRVYVEN